MARQEEAGKLDRRARAAEKEASRQEDDEAVASGKVSAAEMNRRRGHFGRLKARVDYAGARRRW